MLLDIWTRSGAHDGWFVGDYLLMPDHVHFFARFGRDSKSMAEWVKMWKSLSARALDKDSGMAVWQPDYFDRFLRSGESYSEKWAYVQNNPVRAGLIPQADDWPVLELLEFYQQAVDRFLKICDNSGNSFLTRRVAVCKTENTRRSD